MSSIYDNNYFLSDKVKVFPCAYRDSTYDASARLNTEYNFTHLPHTVDKASYLIKFNDIPENEATTKLICVIQGYYFEIELDAGDYTILQNKYLNICVASPNGAGSIESPHLCSWDSSDGVEATLDYKPEDSTYYIFKGLKIGEGALSNGSYQCYALKLDASAKLPIKANKIENIVKNSFGVENGTGKPISQEFMTQTLNVASGKFTVDSSKSNVAITAKVPVTINSTLDVKTGNTSVLKAESTKVTINMPTTIKGTDSNLIVAGKGSFGGKLTVTTGGADITGATDLSGTVGITGKTTIGADETLTEIENDTIKTSKITIEKASNTVSLVIDKKQDNIIEIKDKSNTPIFSVNTDSGETYAKKINAQVEGTSDKAVNAKNVTDTIKGTNITAIFGSTGSAIDELKLKTINPGGASNSGNPIKIVVGANNNTAVKFYNDANKSIVKADTFEGNAKTASAFETDASITLTGDVITSTAATGTHGWTVNTTIQDKAVTNAKLANSSITIGSKTVILGDSIGTSDNPFNGTFYAEELLIYNKNQSMMDPKNPSKVVFGEYNHGGACVKIKAPSSPNSARKAFSIENYTGSNPVIEMYGDLTTSPSYNPIKMRIIADSQGLYGHTDFYGNKISIYSEDYNNEKKYGTLEAGTVDLSASSSNTGLKIAGLNQIKVNGAGLKSSTALQILATASSADEDGYEYVQIGNNSQKYSTLRVTGLSEFTRPATFEDEISVSGTATFMNGISVTGASATFEKGISVSGTATFEDEISVSGTATFMNGISVTGTATFMNGISVSGTAAFGNGISVTGTAEATAFNAQSDKRLKENIIDYKPEKSILDLPIKKFDFIDGPKNQIGCIAQDLKEICPEIVNENEKGYLSIQESKLVYLLLDEVKKLKNEVEELKRN